MKIMNVIATGVLLMLAGCVSTGTEKVSLDKPAQQAGLNIHSWQTSNGTKVFYVHAPELPMLDINVVFDAGSVRDHGKPGLAAMTNGMLAHGAGKLSVEQIAERFDQVGARLGSDVSRDMAEVSLRTLTDKKWMKSALQTFQAVLSQPTFPAAEFERARRQMMIGFRERKQSPGSIVDELFYQNMYGDHPYASPVSGTEQSIKKLRRQDLQKFYKQYYVAANAILTIVGDVDRKQAEQIAEQLMSKLPKGTKAEKIVNASVLTKAKQVHQEHPSMQTHIMMGQQSIDRHDPDYFTLYVGNHILGGGGFGSRIFEEIREKRGLAYSSYSYFYPLRNRGPFIIGMQTSNQQTEQALKVLHTTLDNFIQDGPTAKELLHAKKNITGGFPMRIDSNSDVSNYLAVIGFYNLPLDYLSTFNSKVEAVTTEQIRDAFKRRVNPDRMLTVTVGQSKSSS